MANVTQSSADEGKPLPRRLVYRRLMLGLECRHDGWLFTRADLTEDGLQGDVAATLRQALGQGWYVYDNEDSEVIVSRHDDIAHARAAVERAFPEPSRA